MTGVRWREEFEGLCEACHEWWPLITRFWMRNSGLRRCRACVVERRPVDIVKLEEHRRYNREWMRRYRAERRAV